MGLIATVAFCVAMSSGETGPQPPYECMWAGAEDKVYATQGECMIDAMYIAHDPIVRQKAFVELYAQFGNQGTIHYFTFCVEENELKDFYRSFGFVSEDLGDIPEGT